MEIVHEGWLLKSPPPKTLRRAKWRNRWFILRAGDLPGQYFLEYYTDPSRKKLKGSIDLDQCERVDAGITFAETKAEFRHMFDIKTPKRTYYLCADNDESMTKWVDTVCRVCGLRAMSTENLYDPMSPTTPSTPHPNSHSTGFDPRRAIDMPHIDSPPPSAGSAISGPYIPISECVTGKKMSNSTRFPFEINQSDFFCSQVDASEIPNEIAPPAPTKPSQITEKPISPSSRDENVFMENIPSLASSRSDRTASESDSQVSFLGPPRPPKPAHLSESTYMNVETILNASRRNSVCDKPRLNSFTSQTDVGSSPSYSSKGFAPPNTPRLESHKSYTETPVANGNAGSAIFSYDVSMCSDKHASDPRISPASVYSNVPTPNCLTAPPVVDRGLKPRKVQHQGPGDLVSPLSAGPPLKEGSFGTLPAAPSSAPPIVDRKLKPHKKVSEPCNGSSATPFVLDPAPRSRSKHNHPSKGRAAPSPTPPSASYIESDSDISTDSRRDSICDEQVFFSSCHENRLSNSIQYLDLDLDLGLGSHKQTNVPKVVESSVVYKKVDFLKTEALNKTRQGIEEGYRKGQ